MAAYVPHTPLQDAIMAELHKHPEGISWRDLETATGRSQSAISESIRLLEKKGKVYREKIPAPTRRAKVDRIHADRAIIKLVPEAKE